MTRWTLRITVFLLLGAIVNVAVAWAAVLVSGPSFFRSYPSGFVQRVHTMGGQVDLEKPAEAVQTIVHRHRGFALETVLETRSGEGFGQWSGDIVVARPTQLVVQSDREKRIMAGWPTFALSLEVGPSWPFTLTPHAMKSPTSMRDGIGTPWQYGGAFSREIRLPIAPLLPGFAINTVFYAAVLWLLFAGPFVLRRWRRIRRGLCPKCAYDLRGSDSDVCPECGDTLPFPHGNESR